MDRMLYVAMTGAKETLRAQAANSHNLANASTNGFRADLSAFQARAVAGSGYASRVYATNSTTGWDQTVGAQMSTGRLIGIDISDTGVVNARFTNGNSQPLGQIAIANFANPQGLQQLGDTQWAETFASGQAIRGEAGNSGFGIIQAGALEASNVDITSQLVNMITAQRDFQANAQMISTADAITQTIINIR
jgi:flagellar hook protein FlgE